MNETGLWRYLYKRMDAIWEAERIENLLDEGTPDVYFTTAINGIMGWIELKHKHNWPKRSKTPVRFNHFTAGQKNWIRRHGRSGANILVLIQVDKDYLVFDHSCADFLGDIPRVDLFNLSLNHWKRSIDPANFLQTIEGQS